MTSISPAGGVRAALLVDQDRASLLDLLTRELRGTVYLRSLIHEHGVSPTEHIGHGRFYGLFRQGRVEAVAFAGNGRNLTTYGEADDLPLLLDRVRQGPHQPRLFVGPEEHAPVIRRALFQTGLRPRLDRKQAYYVLDPSRLPSLEPLPLRPAALSELDAVVRAHALMIQEDLGIPFDHLDLGRLGELARQRVEQAKIWVHTIDGELVFKTEEIARSGDAVLVGGVFTDPRFRGQGYASRGMATWAGSLFPEGLQRMALHVNAANTPAFRAYERSGFRRHSMLRLILTY
jgi:hypothetical protein